jgi:DNA modification methylase
MTEHAHTPRTERFPDGVAILGDALAPSTLSLIRDELGAALPLIIADPPYGNVLSRARAPWDRFAGTQREFADALVAFVRAYAPMLVEGGALYVWGGYGRPGFRPFFDFLARVETDAPEVRLANLITWAKRRAYGVQHNYLSTREELAYFVRADDERKPARFAVPYLEATRGYAGFNAKYPARSEHYRRTNVWSDVTELFRGKVHEAQKPMRVYEIPIEVHTVEGDTVLDPFAGSMTLAHAARRLGRRWVCVESDEATFLAACRALREGVRRAR